MTPIPSTPTPTPSPSPSTPTQTPSPPSTPATAPPATAHPATAPPPPPPPPPVPAAEPVLPAARTAPQRKRDTLHRLGHDVDAWVATADPGTGAPYLVPLSFRWDGRTLLFATPAASRTSRNLQATGRVRIGLGPTRDVVLIEGRVESVVPAAEIPAEVGDAFAAQAGFDPRQLATPYHYFHVRPRLLQAWREVNELEGRELIRAGEWTC